MKEYEYGPRTTEEAHRALKSFIDRKFTLSIPVDKGRDTDCIINDVITERDKLREETSILETKCRGLDSAHEYISKNNRALEENKEEIRRLNIEVGCLTLQLAKMEEYANLIAGGLSDYEARGTVWPEERIPQPPPSPPQNPAKEDPILSEIIVKKKCGKCGLKGQGTEKTPETVKTFNERFGVRLNTSCPNCGFDEGIW